MKTKSFFKLRLSYIILLFLFLGFQNIEAQRKKRSKKSKTEKVDKKEKSISDLVKSSKKIVGLFSVYRDTVNGDLQMLINKEHLNNEYIHFSQVADGVTEAGAFRGSYMGSKIFRIKKYFDRIEFIEPNTSSYFDPNNAISKSGNANLSEGIIASIKIEASDKKTGEYLIKANSLFLEETFAQIKPSKRPGQSSTAFSLGSLDKDKTKINEINNYPENTNIKVEYVYSKKAVLNGGSRAVADGRNVSIKVFHTFMKVPENGYKPRFEDPRVGYFTTNVTDMTSTSVTPYRDLVHRWNLVKKDPTADISEPVKPIVWWMENSTPLEFRETIKEAVLRWNIAFEKAGFKNAVVVKQQPDDADWDAGDIRYNVLRWTASPNPPFGGYGPSFVNPRTGQILGADIMLEYVHFTNRVKYTSLYEGNSSMDKQGRYCSLGHIMQENTLFGFAALNAEGADDLEMKGMKREAMLELVMHEVGHTLGLNHNMKASQLHSPEQLNDAEYLKDKALAGSVMDYVSININRNRDQQGHYFSTTLGPYDLWAIEFGYTNFKTEEQKNKLLSKSTMPELLFGNDADDMRSPGKAIDPRVMISDLSNDPIAYSVDRMELVNDMMKGLKVQFTKEGQSYEELRQSFNILSGQYSTAGGIISRFIGGVYVDRAMIGQQGASKPYTPVSLADQKRAMKALSKYMFSPTAFKFPNELYNYIAKQRRGFNFFGSNEDPKIHDKVLNSQKGVLAHLLHYNTLQRISDSQLYGNEYSLSTFMNDLNNSIFKVDIKLNVNSFRQNLQLEYTNTLIKMVKGKNSSRYNNAAKSMALYNLKNINRMVASTNGNISTKAHKYHLKTLITNAIKEIK
ncbi:MAG: zinc-dependent metalloprotease [Flavobacteriaceae bacterium]|nr:zinc-dependent metalloprotease [Flavobacteriaceae bacterium]